MKNFITWGLASLSILGAVLNIKKRRSGFAVYTAANIGWVFVDLYYGIYAQAVLFLVFTALSTWGWIEWGNKKWHRI
ncbi:MAG: nicotinamide mononucleotide transporter [Dissulfurimicrobium sp.]|uniref:nicotinamide mononucleotide transporter n=1 Tax=Dissulfurimicrobium TaxID=1769732 RepID=UPI0038B2FD3F|nr:nicotinamide mononucleotide transporter family protein [Dissulfurimicrobium hydrothermale]